MKYGEPVVQSCIENQADHVDISGEPQVCVVIDTKTWNIWLIIWIEIPLLLLKKKTIPEVPELTRKWKKYVFQQFLDGMKLKYDESAEKAGVHIVGACGYDSVPADVGLCYLMKKFPGKTYNINFFNFEYILNLAWLQKYFLACELKVYNCNISNLF